MAKPVITCAPTGGIHTPSNAAQVRKAGIVEALGFRVATPTQARERLGLKGVDHVSF